MKTPELPKNLAHMKPEEQDHEMEVYRHRFLQFYYVAATMKLNQPHYKATVQAYGPLRQRLFKHASSPWEGDNVQLKSDLIETTKQWAGLASPIDGQVPPCPISYSQDEMAECDRLRKIHDETDAQLEVFSENILGVGAEGSVSCEDFDTAMERSKRFKELTLRDVDDPELIEQINRHWPYDDQDEDE